MAQGTRGPKFNFQYHKKRGTTMMTGEDKEKRLGVGAVWLM
jgi:hypothetical protein